MAERIVSRISRRLPLAAVATLALTIAASAQTIRATGPSPARDHDIQPEDYFGLSFIRSAVISPDGSHIAYTETRWEPENDARNSDLWQVDTTTEAVTRLTFDPAADSGPRWSPDGRWIYFTSRRKGVDDKPPYNNKTQVWRVSVEGGDIVPVTRLGDGVQGFDLSHDGRTLYYIVGKERVDNDRWQSMRKQFDKLTYGHGVVEHSQLWKLDLQTWRSEQILDEKRVIVAMAVAPDERRIAVVTAPTAELITNEGWSQMDVLDTATGRVRTLPDELWRDQAPSPYGWLVTPAWSSDGDTLAFRVDFDGYPGQVFVARFDAEGQPNVSRVQRPEGVSVEGDMTWLPGTADLCFIAEDHARVRVYRLPGVGTGRPGEAIIMTPGDVAVGGFSFTRDGEQVAVIMNDVHSTKDLYVLPTATEGGQVRRVTRINPQVDTWKLPQIQIVKWTSPDGTPVEGILELPPDYQPGDGPLPTVVEIHGGPTSSTHYCFRFWIYGRTMFAARGWAMFSPNYRGSTGYGDEFLTDLIGNKNRLDVQDILSGVDMLVETGVSDPERLAVMGWSNGGYLTNCLITSTDRFKAASSGAGVFDTVMQWSIEDTPGHVINYSQGLPWTNPQGLHRSSPLYSVDKVVTPTLIHVGENDPRVPVEHSRSLHRSLHHYVKVPCELVIYPGAGHGLTKYQHRKAKLEWDLKWFDYWVLGEDESEEK